VEPTVDPHELAKEVVPPVKKAVDTYHTAALIKDPDAEGDPVAENGREILQAVYWRAQPVEPLETAVDDLATSPGDDDAVAELRIQIGKALSADETLVEQVSKLNDERKQQLSACSPAAEKPTANGVERPGRRRPEAEPRGREACDGSLQR